MSLKGHAGSARAAVSTNHPWITRDDHVADASLIARVPGMEPKTLDHVAFWLADREPIAEFVTTRLGLHVIDRQDNFTLVGADARRGKLTLFDAEGPRDPGAFKHVALRVSKLPEGETEFELGEGVKLILVEASTDSEYDLDHVALFSDDPAQTAEAYERFGFDGAEASADGRPRVQVGGAYIE